MSNIKVIISEVDYDSTTESFPVTTITLDCEDVDTVQKLEGLFKAVALAAGFIYIGKVECKSLKNLEVEE